MAWKERYMEAVDVETSYRLAKEMESYRSNPKLGYRRPAPGLNLRPENA